MAAFCLFALERDPPANHRQIRAHGAETVGGNRQEVVVEDDEVAELADFDRTAVLLVEAEPGGGARHHAQRLLPCHRFAGTQHPP